MKWKPVLVQAVLVVALGLLALGVSGAAALTQTDGDSFENPIAFLAGLALGFVIGVPVLARTWQVDVRGALKHV